MTADGDLPRRRLGRTGLDLSMLGFGGFHLVEIPARAADRLLHRYLDEGGNYLETAASYGDGTSEAKIGAAVAHRRADYHLATKSVERTADGAARDLEGSLRRLKTDHVDIFFMHSVGTIKDLDAITSTGGALEAAQRARRDGKTRFIGITAHGLPEALLAALDRFHFDVLMTGMNYFDRFNFPSVEAELIPKALRLGVGLLAMKPIADGFLWRSAATAFRYTWGLPVAAIVAGINTEEQLVADLEWARRWRPMVAAEREALFRNAPELGTYVCRQCGKCLPCARGIDIPRVFELEGWYDRQMRDGAVRDPAEYGMRERLRFWFNNRDRAREAYATLPVKVDQCGGGGGGGESGRSGEIADQCAGCAGRCPYGLDIPFKLDYADFKLRGDRPLF